MPTYHIRPIEPADQSWLSNFIEMRWGVDTIAAHDKLYTPSQLPGFVAEVGEDVLGLVTYSIEEKECEIITLDSLNPKIGIGAALIDEVTKVASIAECRRVWLMTTNDNVNALEFYQKHGFRMVAVHIDAVNRSRLLKPSIPTKAPNGIPIQDEIELEFAL